MKHKYVWDDFLKASDVQNNIFKHLDLFQVDLFTL